MIAFIDDHREVHGIEPICKVLPIAPSTNHADVAKRANPEKLSARARRDMALKPEIARVFAENFEVYGVRKVWRQLRRESFDVARCTMERLMRGMGWRDPRQARPDHHQRQGGAVPAGPRQSPVPRAAPECVVGLGLYLCLELDGCYLCRLRHRRLCATHRRLADFTDRPCELCSRCA
jgi:transposase InsO family protein